MPDIKSRPEKGASASFFRRTLIWFVGGCDDVAPKCRPADDDRRLKVHLIYLQNLNRKLNTDKTRTA